MKAKLARVGLNELLDFVRLDHSTLHHPSVLILPFNIPRAAWRFTSTDNQSSIPVRGSQHPSCIST
jgi:hypothetical protein